MIGLKEHEILYDTGDARRLVAQINRMAKEGWRVGMSSRSNEEEKSRNIRWAIWLPILVATIGAAIWFFLFIIMDLGG